MIKVILTDSSGREREVDVDSEPKTLGRGEDSDVVLGSRSVSRHHLRLWEEDGKVMVEDLTGGTGISIDGELVSGVFELEPGVEMEAGVFVFHIFGTEPVTSIDGEVLEDTPVPILKGTKGPTKGLEIELQEGDNDVGRDPSLYLVIDDPSVSRQHARLVVEAGKFTLIDMHSSNGTFVNNRRVDQAQLTSGDLVRFGNLEFRFMYGEFVSTEAAKMKRKKILILCGAGLTVLIVIFVLVKLLSPKPPVNNGSNMNLPKGPPLEVRVAQHIRTAKGFMENASWKEAIKELDAALEIHPICRECKKLKSRIEDEMRNKSLFDRCIVDYELNYWKPALKCFLKLPPGTYYWKKSKYKVSDCKNRLKKFHLSEGKGFFEARRYKEAHKHFVEIMKLDPCNQVVFNKWLKKTEKRLKSRGIRRGWKPYKWKCDSQGSSDGMSEDPEELMRAKYPDKRLYKIISLYYKGKADSAIQEAAKIGVTSRDKKIAEQAKDLKRSILVVKGRYNDGVSMLLMGKLDKARERFNQAMAVDKVIMPDMVTSFYRDEIGRKLAGKLHKQALSQYNQKHYKEAFEIWSECLKRNPSAKSCKSGMNMLDDIGNDALKFAEDLEARGDKERMLQVLKHILEITPDDSMSHKKAQIWLNKLED